jgi:hypothetical protein
MHPRWIICKRTEYWMDLDYFPIRDTYGMVGGVTCILADHTEQVINARRIRSLHELIVQVNCSQTITEVCQTAASAMCTNSRDVSSAYIYMIEQPIPGLETANTIDGSPSLNLMANQGKVRAILEAANSIPLREVVDGYWQSASGAEETRSTFLVELDDALRTMTSVFLRTGLKDAPAGVTESPTVIVSRAWERRVVFRCSGGYADSRSCVQIPLIRENNQIGLVLMVLELNVSRGTSHRRCRCPTLLMGMCFSPCCLMIKHMVSTSRSSVKLTPKLTLRHSFAVEYIETMGNALSARIAAIKSEAERLQALQASSERKARESLLLQRTADAERLQQRQEYFIDMISHEVGCQVFKEMDRSFLSILSLT